jgi:branched-chain amino acid transport system substrate-binding protein
MSPPVSHAPRRTDVKTSTLVTRMAGCVAVTVLMAGCASTSTSASKTGAKGGSIALGQDAKKTTLRISGGDLKFDVFAPFSGPDARFGNNALPGASVGAEAVNAAGGVLGHNFGVVHSDSRGDPADAVPALQQALASTGNLEAVLGPTSDEALATIPILRREGVPSFDQAGSIQLDTLQSPWIYRILSSDSQDASAMAYQAVFLDHAKRVALVFSADGGSQSLVKPLKAILAKMKATVVTTESLTPDQPSYRTQALQIQAAKPQVILTETDDATAATLWSQMEQLGGLTVPIVGSGPTTGQDYFQAVNKALGSSTPAFLKQYSGVQFSTANTCASSTFLTDFHKLYPGKEPQLGHVNYYDSVVLAALAMLKAKSTDPNKWMPEVHTITNPPAGATRVCTFAEGKQLLSEGKTITYVGTKGPMTVNASNTVTVNEEAIGFDGKGNPLVKNQLTSAELQPYNAGI